MRPIVYNVANFTKPTGDKPALITIDEPEGVYYGGTIAAPVIGDLFRNILPYMGIADQSASENPNTPQEEKN